MITSGSDDKAGFGCLDAAAVAMFEVISKALPGFFNTLVANFFPASAEILSMFLKKLDNPSACLVLSLRVIVVFQLQIDYKPIGTLLPLEVISPKMCFVADRCLPPTQ